jgi:glutamate racemase
VARLSPEATVVQAACPALVPLIEAGVQDGEALAAVQESLQPLLAADVDTLIFGCTHYPLLRAQFRSALGDQVALVDPAHEVARQAAEGLRSLGLVAPATPAASAEGAHVLLASGPTAELERQARIWLPGPCEGPHVLDLHGGQTDVATSV